MRMLATARHSPEVGLVVRLLRLDYEHTLDSLVTCDEAQVMYLRAKAKAYRDLIMQLTRVTDVIAQVSENK